MIKIPAIDLLDNKAVRLQMGDYTKVTVYDDNPVDLAQKFSQAGITHLHIVDLTGAKAEKPQHAKLIRQMKEVSQCTIETGGGIRNLAQAEYYFNEILSDNDLLMIGSLPIVDETEFKKIALRYADRLLITVDVLGREVRVSGWQKSGNIMLDEFLKKLQAYDIDKVLVTQILKDGMLSGPDLELYKEITRDFPALKVTASGGVAYPHDLKALADIPVHAVVVGKAYYEGNISLAALA